MGETSVGGGWRRVAGLFLLTLALSVTRPAVLILVPFVLLGLTLRPRTPKVVFLAILAFVVVSTGEPEGIWWLERGWTILVGGWFLALTLRWPSSAFFPRALGAVTGAFAAASLVFLVRPGSWPIVEWLVVDRLRRGVAEAVSLLLTVGGEGFVPGGIVEAAYRTVEGQGTVFPALLGLSSVAGLGVAWWTYVRLTEGRDDGVGPLPRFRFHDALIWVFIGGLTMVLVGSSGVLERVGTNAVVFMGGLFALRGLAVVLFVSGGLSVLGSAFLALAFVFVAPMLLAGAVVVGLGDTWLDLRERARATGGR